MATHDKNGIALIGTTPGPGQRRIPVPLSYSVWCDPRDGTVRIELNGKESILSPDNADKMGTALIGWAAVLRAMATEIEASGTPPAAKPAPASGGLGLMSPRRE